MKQLFAACLLVIHLILGHHWSEVKYSVSFTFTQDTHIYESTLVVGKIHICFYCERDDHPQSLFLLHNVD